MIDYKQQLPEDIASAYDNITGSYLDRGSVMMMGASHVARQRCGWKPLCPRLYNVLGGFCVYLNTGRGVSAVLLPVNLRFWVPNLICGTYPNLVGRVS